MADAKRTDWPFVAFVAFSLLVASFTGVQRARYSKALGAFARCAADADSSCASSTLEDVRSIDASNPRSLVAEAELRVLLGQTREGEIELARLLVGTPTPAVARATSAPAIIVARGASLPPGLVPVTVNLEPSAMTGIDKSLRGDVFLVVGDIAAARGDKERATARWAEAGGIVDPSLIAPRRERLEKRGDVAREKLSAELEQLRTDFESLFSAALRGEETVAYTSSELRTRAAKVSGPTAPRKLALAIDMANRAANEMRSRRGIDDAVPSTVYKPQPPIAPTDEELRRSPWRRDAYAREQQYYQRALDRWRTQESETERRRFVKKDNLATNGETMINQARALLEQGLAEASTSDKP